MEQRPLFNDLSNTSTFLGHPAVLNINIVVYIGIIVYNVHFIANFFFGGGAYWGGEFTSKISLFEGALFREGVYYIIHGIYFALEYRPIFDVVTT